MPSGGEHLGGTPFMMQGFGDINYIAKAPDGERTGFRDGAFDLFATSRLGDHWSALAELVFETDGNNLATDLERFQFTYEHSDAFRLSVGRMHTTLLRWPVTNHHGLFTQTPVDRPIIARWEDAPGLWPNHFVGILAQGRLHNAAGVRYAAGVGNGRGPAVDEVQVGSDANDQRAVVVSAGISPDAAPGLEVDVSGYFDRIPAVASLDERDYAVSTAYVRGGAEVRAEWSRMTHAPVDAAVTYTTTGWYVLAAHRLSRDFARVKPYVLIEQLDVARDETYFGGVPNERAWAIGVRWDINQFAALKADYRSRKLEAVERSGAVRAQLAVGF